MSIPANKSNSKVFLILGVLCAVIAAALIWYAVSQGSGSKYGPSVNVLVASQTISAGANVTSQQVTVTSEPQSLVPADALTDPSQIVGKALVSNASAHTILTQSMILSSSNQSAAVSGTTACQNIPQILPKGTVALAIPAGGQGQGNLTGVSADLMSVGYYIQPGDHIDIIADDGHGNVRYLFQDIKVLCVGVQGSGTAAPSVYIVQVQRGVAEQLTWIVTHTGNAATNTYFPIEIKYVLRPASEYGTPTKPNYEGSTPANSTVPQVTDPPVTPTQIQQMFSSGQ